MSTNVEDDISKCEKKFFEKITDPVFLSRIPKDKVYSLCLAKVFKERGLCTSNKADKEDFDELFKAGKNFEDWAAIEKLRPVPQ